MKVVKEKTERWKESDPAPENAARLLPPMLAAYLEAGRLLADGTPTATSLHGLRLHGKRLRYAMELFRPCYGTAFETYLGLLKDAQGILGDLNDCATLLRVLPELPGPEEKKARLKNRVERSSAKLFRDFQRFWKEKMDHSGKETRWASYLAHPRKPAKKGAQ